MTVMLISAVFPFPVDAGKKVVLAGFIRYFADRYGADHVHYILVGRPETPEFPVRLYPVEGPSKYTAMANAVLRVPTGRSSLQEALLRSRSTADGIRRWRDEIQPTTEIYDTIRMAQYADSGFDNKICYLDDLFSERYARMLQAAREHPDVDIQPLGNFAQHVPASLRPLANHRLGQTALLRTERRLVQRAEERAARTFARCLLVNADEAALLARGAGVPADRVRAVPPLVTPPAQLAPRSVAQPVFVFLGLLALPHNDDGVRWFLNAVWPRVAAQLPGARLRIIGRSPRPEVLAAAQQQGPDVTVEGYVEDLSDVMAGATALVNPLRFGSGIKLKVIEALARGVPVVSTAVGAEGIRTGPDAGVLVTDDPAEFADLMSALTAPQSNRSASDAALAHFDAVYSESAVYASYDAAFRIAP